LVAANSLWFDSVLSYRNSADAERTIVCVDVKGGSTDLP
jgi:hypothetical protein